MKNPAIILSVILGASAALASCGGRNVQSRCDVEVYTPEKRYTEARLYDTAGNMLDSTLRVANDSVRFSRTDSLAMPYVAQLRLRNPSDSLDVIYMPVVIEGGTVRLELSDRIELGGTPDNERMYEFQKAKNTFTARYENEGHDVEKLKEDYSRFFAAQALENRGSIVGRYILEVYGKMMTRDDLARVREEIKEK